MKQISDVKHYKNLLQEIKQRIHKAQYEALKAVNKELIALYWDIGALIVEKQKKHGWGKSIVENLARDLQLEFPGMQGFSSRNIWYMRTFFMVYSKDAKLQPLVAEVGWAHNVVIMEKCKDMLEREFYIRMTRRMGWTKNALINHIENKAYERTLVNQTNFSKVLPEKIHRQAKLAVKDEYTFDFLELGEEYDEAVLDDRIRAKGENPSIGIIVCKSKARTIVEYALRESKKPIGVATYRMTERLPKDLRRELPSPEQVSKLLSDIAVDE